ncbi:sensor histidine kinase [Candidatus Latescibacterota bacterium]
MSRPGTEPFSGNDISLLEGSTEDLALGGTGFLDLQAAQERAAQSAREAAYERVRSAVLASRSTDDILAVNFLLERELRELGVRVAACSINLIDEDAGTWRTSWRGTEMIPLDSPVAAEVVARQRGGEIFMRPREGDPAELESSRPARVVIDVPFAYGTLAVSSADAEEFSQEETEIIQGFADVISPAYARYLDFERVEEQNRVLKEANQSIQEGTAHKSEFLCRMSHDLRTPMNAIIGYTHILLRRLKGAIEERQYRNLENIQTSADNLLGLVNEILDLSRIEAGRIDLKPEPVDVGQLVSECITSVVPLAKPGVELVQELDEVSPISTDTDRIRRVVMNLLGNAVKFTEQGSITVSLKPVGSGVELAVTDTGVGIPVEDLPHIFAEYRQVERQVGEKTEGTGLGLAIAAKSVEMLGGSISAESEVGKGTAFTVRLGDYV